MSDPKLTPVAILARVINSDSRREALVEALAVNLPQSVFIDVNNGLRARGRETVSETRYCRDLVHEILEYGSSIEIPSVISDASRISNRRERPPAVGSPGHPKDVRDAISKSDADKIQEALDAVTFAAENYSVGELESYYKRDCDLRMLNIAADIESRPHLAEIIADRIKELSATDTSEPEPEPPSESETESEPKTSLVEQVVTKIADIAGDAGDIGHIVNDEGVPILTVNGEDTGFALVLVDSGNSDDDMDNLVLGAASFISEIIEGDDLENSGEDGETEDGAEDIDITEL